MIETLSNSDSRSNVNTSTGVVDGVTILEGRVPLLLVTSSSALATKSNCTQVAPVIVEPVKSLFVSTSLTVISSSSLILRVIFPVVFVLKSATIVKDFAVFLGISTSIFEKSKLFRVDISVDPSKSRTLVMLASGIPPATAGLIDVILRSETSFARAAKPKSVTSLAPATIDSGVRLSFLVMRRVELPIVTFTPLAEPSIVASSSLETYRTSPKLDCQIGASRIDPAILFLKFASILISVLELTVNEDSNVNASSPVAGVYDATLFPPTKSLND